MSPKYAKWSMASLTVLIILSACAPKCNSEEPIIILGDQAGLVDKSLLTQAPCEVPCWQGIVPGTTSKAEAIDILEDLEFVDSNSLPSSEGGGELVTWKTIFSEDQGQSGRIATDETGTVSRIDIFRLWYRVTLEELIEVIGEPDGIITLPYGVPDGSADCISIRVIWFDEGLEVYLADLPATDASKVPLVMPQSLISRVSYFPPVSDLDGYLSMDGSPYLSDNFISWEGFQ